MLKRLYIHNFRCFENFEFRTEELSAILLLGNNGSGKSSIRHVLSLFQSLGRGNARLGELLRLSDFTLGRNNVPMRFELEVVLQGKHFRYSLALELPDRFRELRVMQENLSVDGVSVFDRESAEVTVHRMHSKRDDAVFPMDWHLIALPIIQDTEAAGSLQVIRNWFANMVLLSPIPQLIGDEARGVQTAINETASNLSDWLASLLERYPSAYNAVIEHVRRVMPDLSSFRFERLGREVRSLIVQFSQDATSFELPFSELSDGEKCFFLSGILLAANQTEGPIFAFWDEPDNYLALHEVNQFVVNLKRSFFQTQGQLIASSHNAEAVLCFSKDDTWVLGRRNHLEPSIIRNLAEISVPRASGSDDQSDSPDILQQWCQGDLKPW